MLPGDKKQTNLTRFSGTVQVFEELKPILDCFFSDWRPSSFGNPVTNFVSLEVSLRLVHFLQYICYHVVGRLPRVGT